MTALTTGVAGCVGRSPAPTVTTTVTGTQTRTNAPAPQPTVTAPSTVAPLAPGTRPRAGERDGDCPYIRAGTGSVGDEGGRSIADLEGDHVYRTTVLTRTRPVGCRFYFYSLPYEALADIVPRTFPTAAAAHNAMVLVARTGTEQIGVPMLAPRRAPGVQGILFRTRFFGPDDARDWALVFAAGRVTVLVRTQRADTSGPARYIAQAIAARFLGARPGRGN